MLHVFSGRRHESDRLMGMFLKSRSVHGGLPMYLFCRYLLVAVHS